MMISDVEARKLVVVVDVVSNISHQDNTGQTLILVLVISLSSAHHPKAQRGHGIRKLPMTWAAWLHGRVGPRRATAVIGIQSSREWRSRQL